MNRLPRSMAGQLFALLVSAMAMSHLIVVLILWQWQTTEEIHRLSAREIESRITAAYRAVTGHPDNAATLIAELSLPESSFALNNTKLADGTSMDAQEQALAQSLRERLELPFETPIRVRLQRADLLAQAGETVSLPVHSPDISNAWILDVDLALPDGRFLYSRHWPAMKHVHWLEALSFSIPIVMLPTFVVAFLFGRRIMRPLNELTAAAKLISRGEQVPRIRPKGPDDVREVLEAFNDMQEQLIRYVQDRTRMLAAIGHDLRTPLTSLRIRAELIDDDQLRTEIITTLKEMTVMTEATLQLTRDDAAQEPLQMVDLGELLSEVVEHQRMLGRQVDWAAPSGIAYCCRPVHLKRALDNLIDNATRYGNTAVRIIPGVEQGWRIEVDDDGPGIPQDKIEQAFEPFIRLDDSRNQETGGAGLGLAIARSCVRAHGGELSLHERPGGGLRAVISLPR